MYYTDNMLLPEYMDPLIITAAPYGPQYLPGDCDVPVTWDEQVQAAVDCYEAMPANPVDAKKGLQHWETDGKRFAATIASDSHPIAACMLPPERVVEVQKKKIA